MPGTSSVYPHEVLPSLERPQPVHWPQEVSNCLSLPPGNSASQTELGSVATGVEVAFQQATDGCTILRGTSVHPPSRTEGVDRGQKGLPAAPFPVPPALGIAGTSLV